MSSRANRVVGVYDMERNQYRDAQARSKTMSCGHRCILYMSKPEIAMDLRKTQEICAKRKKYALCAWDMRERF